MRTAIQAARDVGPTNYNCYERRDEVFDQCCDERPEGRTHDDGDCEIKDVPRNINCLKSCNISASPLSAIPNATLQSPVTLGSLIVQNPPNLRSKIRIGEGLEDDLDAGIEAALMHDGVSRIPGRIEDLETWSPTQSLLRKLPTVHAAGKPHIRKKEVDFAVRI
jgi:hypothetical protein